MENNYNLKIECFLSKKDVTVKLGLVICYVTDTFCTLHYFLNVSSYALVKCGITLYYTTCQSPTYQYINIHI